MEQMGTVSGMVRAFMTVQDKAQITRMGLAFSNQITEPFIHEEHDRKMDKIVTEEIIYSFLRI